MGRTVDLDQYYKIGTINSNISSLVNFKYKGTIYAAPGVIKHISRRHGNQLPENILTDLIGTITSVLEDPDYVGKHPDKDGKALEVVKRVSINLMVGIEVSTSDQEYIYVSTLFPITESKIANRVISGRLVEIDKRK